IGWRYRRGRKKTGTNCFCWAQFEGPVGRTIPAHTHRDIHTHKCPCTHVQAQHTPHTFTYICKYPYATHTHTLTISHSLTHTHTLFCPHLSLPLSLAFISVCLSLNMCLSLSLSLSLSYTLCLSVFFL